MDEGSKQPTASPEPPSTGWYRKETPRPRSTAAPIANPGQDWENTQQTASEPSQGEIEWTASEFIAHEKGFGWYAALAIATIGVSTLIYFITDDIFSIVIIIILAIIFAVGAGVKPRVLPYHLDDSLLAIGEKTFSLSQFKSFMIVEEGAFSHITLTPMKRFGLPTNVYYPPEEEAQIVATLSTHLPMEPTIMTTLDHLVRRIRY